MWHSKYMAAALAACAASCAAQQMTVVKPRASDAVLNNPGEGFTTFQRFNGDQLNGGTAWTEGMPIEFQAPSEVLRNPDYPLSSIAYLRLYWRFIEPSRGQYRWELIDRALETAQQRGQTLMLRIAPYGTDEATDVPAWYRKETGEVLDKSSSRGGWQATTNKWMVDPENAAYAKEFGSFTRELGKRYDGDPRLELVDISILAAWGEGAGSELLTENTRRLLLDSYLDSFHKTPLVTQLSDAKTIAYTLSRARSINADDITGGNARSKNSPVIGWRADCLGDMGGFSATYNMMTDNYPEAIVDLGLSEAWKHAPVSMESCWVMQKWKDEGWDLQYIMDQAVKWHVSSFNAKSSAVPAEWWPQVNWWLNHMGYRFALRRFAFPPTVGATRRLTYQSWWENKGNAPIYRTYAVALRLTRDQQSTVVALDGDIQKWLPGDALLDGSVFLPAELADGEYQLAIALVDAATRSPRIKLAVQGVDPDGWYTLGAVQLETKLTARSTAGKP